MWLEMRKWHQYVLWLETNRGFYPLHEDQIIEKSTLWLPLTGDSEGDYL